MDPGLIFSEIIDPQEGLPQFKARSLAKKAGLPSSLYVKLGQIAAQLYEIFVAQDAIILEINPLVLTEGGELYAADGKMDLDDDALFRHPEWAARPFEGTEIEAKARGKNLRFVELEGDIGICGNGAGMMMTAMDLIVRKGGRPANFCEAGGAHAQAGSGRGAIEWWRDAVDLVLSNQKVTRLLFNLVGGNQRGDEVAQGIVEALRDKKIPAFIRLTGTNQEEGRSILAEHGFRSYDTLEEAVAALIQWRD
jgi:succinyl-CoA synthetase beta subunit